MPDDEFRLLVCGGRDFHDESLVFLTLDLFVPRPTMIIHGDALGADKLAGRWAEKHEIRVARYPCTPSQWERYPQDAGHRRNARMLEQSKPNACLAFPGHGGTEDMVTRCEDIGVIVYRVRIVRP